MLVTVLLFLLSKSKNGGAIRQKKLFMDRSEIRFLFYMRTVQSRTGTKVTRVRSATEMKSDHSEFISRSVNAWKEIDFWFWFHFSLWRSTLTIHFWFCVLTFGAWPLSAAIADRLVREAKNAVSVVVKKLKLPWVKLQNCRKQIEINCGE